MLETTQTLLGETSELLESLMPVMQRSIDTLKHDPNPLVQHLIAEEIKHQEGLLEQMEKIKKRLHDCLNPPDKVAQPTQSHHVNLHPDLHPDEIADGPPVSSFGSPPVGAAVLKSYPLTVTIPEKDLEIKCRYGIDTLIKVVNVLGIEKVRALGIMVGPIPLVAIKDYDGCQQKKVGGYYIAAKTTTFIKARLIDMIRDFLDIELYVEQNNIKSVPN